MTAPGARPTLSRRAAGILMHLTSLPGPHGIGDMGPQARRFAGFLASAGQTWWQMLPVNPAAAGNSPYTAYSAFAGEPCLVSLEGLAAEKLLEPGDLEPPKALAAGRVRFGEARRFKDSRFRKAFEAFERSKDARRRERFEKFCSENDAWLSDYALFCALKRAHHGRWTDWPRELRSRQPSALAAARRQHGPEIRYQQFLQHLFHAQWTGLRERCRKLGLALLGDAAIYVAHDSAEVWARPDLFFLDAEGRPTVVSGVPPDYFSKTGQLWGTPLYRWDAHRAEGYRWWIARLKSSFERFDAVRLDHFIGFQNYWEVPGSARTAEKGRWVDGPKDALFEEARRTLGPLEIIAEDLGCVTPEVAALRKRQGFPGMRVLQFAFGGDHGANEHLPHNCERACALYTGTHDNETTAAWFGRLPKAEREFALRYLGSDGKLIHWDMIRAAWMSVAGLAIAPVQDLLGAGDEARMNFPGTAEGNWEWRLEEGALTPKIAERLRLLTETYGRAP